MYNKILVPTDGSDNSMFALKQAIKLAGITGAEITIMHVLDIPPQVKSIMGDEINVKVEEAGAAVMKKAAEICKSSGVSFMEKMVWGVPEYEIVREVDSGRFDLVVIGSRGLGEVKGWLLGSVSRRVVRHARCPVLVIK